MKKIVLISIAILLLIIVTLYSIFGILFYYNQEKLIFHPDPTIIDWKIPFDKSAGFPNFSESEDISLVTKDNVKISSVLAKSPNSKGVVLYFHNNNANIWYTGTETVKYSEQGYDVMMLDYRGFGKSEGRIQSEQDIYNDAQSAYDFLKAKYSESQIIVAGREFGTAPATKMAQLNNPKQLILDRPFFSGDDFLFQVAPFIPSQALKYKLAINEMLPQVKAPITIIYSQRSLPISIKDSERLTKLFKVGDQYFPESLEFDFDAPRDPKLTADEDFDIKLKAYDVRVKSIMAKVIK